MHNLEEIKNIHLRAHNTRYPIKPLVVDSPLMISCFVASFQNPEAESKDVHAGGLAVTRSLLMGARLTSGPKQ